MQRRLILKNAVFSTVQHNETDLAIKYGGDLEKFKTACDSIVHAALLSTYCNNDALDIVAVMSNEYVFKKLGLHRREFVVLKSVGGKLCVCFKEASRRGEWRQNNERW